MKRSGTQNNSIHKGCQQLADLCIENNVTVNMILETIEVRPTAHNMKEILKAVIKSKYGYDSTTQLETGEVDPPWEELATTVGKLTGTYIPFPSRESQMFNSLEDSI